MELNGTISEAWALKTGVGQLFRVINFVNYDFWAN